MGWYSEVVVPWLAEGPLSDPALGEIRADMLRDVHGETLEIGFGSGANLPYYPPRLTQLTAVEPSTGMTKRAQDRIAAWHGKLALRELAGERLPFESASFDQIIITLTLCSVHDVGAVVAEMHRVLRPGGRVHFLEHVASHSPRARRWQNRLNGISRLLSGNCHLNRDAVGAYRAAGFELPDLREQPLPGPPAFLQPLYPAVRGVAVKPA